MGPNRSGSLSLLSISAWFLFYILITPEREPVAHHPALTPRTVILASGATEALSSSAIIPLFTFVPCMMHVSPLKFQAHLKSSISFYLNLNTSHDNFVLLKQCIEELLWRRILHYRNVTIMSKTMNVKRRTKRRSKIKTSMNIKVLRQQHFLYLKLFKASLWEFPRQIYRVFFLPKN